MLHFAKALRHWVWMRNPFCSNPVLDGFLASGLHADCVVANGDYSCDSAFVGISDSAAFQSASQCLGKLRDKFGHRLRVTIGDHELGKKSMFGGRGGMRLESWRRATGELALAPFWRVHFGNYVLMGIVSSLVALPVFLPDLLPAEAADWELLRQQHLAEIRAAFMGLLPDQRVLLFCHDPTALSFLWRESVVREKAAWIECAIIGHLHSRLVLWKSQLLAGMPVIRFLGHTPKRMTTALNQARCWRPFHVRLCPSLAGIQLFNSGGYLAAELDPAARQPARFHFHPLAR